MKRLIAFLCLFILSISLSNAAVIINVVESGGDVVATASGTINTAGLGNPASASASGFVRGGGSWPGVIVVGPGKNTSGIFGVDAYSITPTANVFSTGGFFSGTLHAGDTVGILSNSSLGTSIYVLANYVSNSLISATTTWGSHTIASLNLIPGTYVWAWGSGANADSLTLNIGPIAPPAALTINVVEDGLNVVATSSGSVDTTGLTAGSNSFAYNAGGETLGSDSDRIWFGVGASDFDTFLISTVSSGFNSGSTQTFTDVSVSGDWAGVSGGPYGGELYLPKNYVSNTSISGTATWLNESIATLNLIPGTYVSTLGNGATVTLNIGGSVTPTTYTVGGAVSGLTGSVTLQNNSGDNIVKTTNNGFTFPAQAEGTDYAVTVSSQPTGQTCTVGNGSGVNITTNIDNVTVTCVDDVVPTYSVGGTVSGLTGFGLHLENNNTNAFTVGANGSFTFTTELPDTSAYAVTVSAQPTGQTCTVTGGGNNDGSGTIAAADVISVAVDCVDDVVVVGQPPSGPATPVPTMSVWGLGILIALMGLIGFNRRRRI